MRKIIFLGLCFCTVIITVTADVFDEMRTLTCDGGEEQKQGAIDCVKAGSAVLWKVLDECKSKYGEAFCNYFKEIKKCGMARQSEVIQGSSMSKLMAIPKCVRAVAKKYAKT